MPRQTSWPIRCAWALLTLQLVTACGGGGGGGNDGGNPSGQDTTAPTTRATPQGGSFGGGVTVTLACDDGAGSGCAATHYTLDGSTPTASSPSYSEALTLNESATLKFFSVDKAGNAEAVKQEQYTITSGGRDTVAPTTVASPAGGAYNSPRSVALQCADEASGCAATYYTQDGSVPTEQSTRYTAPVNVTASTTLRFFSVDKAGNTEAVRTERYVLDTEAPTVSATPRGGTYASARTVTLACDDGAGSGCGAIHFTTDGSQPTTSSPAYSQPLTVASITTLRFFAVDKAGNASPVVSETYVFDTTGPSTTPSQRGGNFAVAFTVTLACEDDFSNGCAGTYYTTDGTTPTRGSPRYGQPIAITNTTTLKFFSVDPAGNEGPVGTEVYVLDFATPVTTATPAGNTYSGEQSVTLACNDGAGTGCAATYYTLDGSTPTPSSALYTGPLRIAATTTLRFFSVDKVGNRESPKTESYLIDSAAPVTTVNPKGGTTATAQTVTLSCNDGLGSGCAGTFFTTDGSPPTTGSPRYTGPLTLNGNTVLKFFSVDAAGNSEAVHTETYTIDTAAPVTTASPSGGTFGTAQTVTLTCDDGTGTGCAETRYTLDGTAPTTSSPRYTQPFSIATTTALRFFSVDTAGNREPVRVVAFTIDTVAPTTTASPKGGSFASAQTVTLTCADSGGSTCGDTRYTTDGSTPTASSQRYTAPFTVSASTTLKFFSVDALGNAEAVKTEQYVIDTAPPVTTATPKGGAYRTAQTVSLSCDDGSGVGCSGSIRYTVDGSPPTATSPAYTSPITVSATTTLKFFSVDGLGNTEAVKTEQYVIDATPPTVSASPKGGVFSGSKSVTLACDDGAGSGCAGLYYTTNNTAPSTGSTRYTAPLSLSSTTVLRFIGVDAAGNVSTEGSETYSFDNQAPVSTVTPPGGTYSSTQLVLFGCTDDLSGCAATYYTTDGSPPTTSSSQAGGGLPISSNTTLKFFSVDKAGNAESVKTQVYTFDFAAPVTTASPAGGTYASAQTVTLTCSDGTGSGCAATYYTLDGSPPSTGSLQYAGPFSVSRSLQLRFFSVDKAGNAELSRTETYTLPGSPGDTSDQIRAVRTAADGTGLSLRIDGALVTYAKPLIGSAVNDPAGFFLQAEKNGPALFVALDATMVSPPLAVGDRVALTVTSKSTVSGMVRATAITAVSISSRNNPVAPLVQDVSNVDLPPVVADYESELITLSGTVTGAFTNAGAGFVQAPLATLGTPAGSPNAPSLRFRAATTVQDPLDLAANCSFTVVAPLWLFTTTTQPSAWDAADITARSCPAPKVVSAQATSPNKLTVFFDRRIDPASVAVNGSQFSFNGGLFASAATVVDREVQLTTNTQVGGLSYTVSVAGSVRDTLGSALDGTARSTSFFGYVQPAVLRISEVAPNLPGGRDIVELSVVAGGSVEKMILMDGTTTLATLPAVLVSAGDVIVIHLNPDKVTPNTDAPASETQSKSEYASFPYASNYDNAWDFHGGTTGIAYTTSGPGQPGSNHLFRVKDPAGLTQDVLAVTSPGNTFAAFPAQLQAAQAEGLWLPADCAGVPCTYSSFPTANDVSADWGIGLPQNRGTTFGRVSFGDTNTRDDWTVGPGTLGFNNP